MFLTSDQIKSVEEQIRPPQEKPSRILILPLTHPYTPGDYDKNNKSFEELCRSKPELEIIDTHHLKDFLNDISGVKYFSNLKGASFNNSWELNNLSPLNQCHNLVTLSIKNTGIKHEILLLGLCNLENLEEITFSNDPNINESSLEDVLSRLRSKFPKLRRITYNDVDYQ